jgi:hypothetical protein
MVKFRGAGTGLAVACGVVDRAELSLAVLDHAVLWPLPTPSRAAAAKTLKYSTSVG